MLAIICDKCGAFIPVIWADKIYSPYKVTFEVEADDGEKQDIIKVDLCKSCMKKAVLAVTGRSYEELKEDESYLIDS